MSDLPETSCACAAQVNRTKIKWACQLETKAAQQHSYIDSTLGDKNVEKVWKLNFVSLFFQKKSFGTQIKPGLYFENARKNKEKKSQCAMLRPAQFLKCLSIDIEQKAFTNYILDIILLHYSGSLINRHEFLLMYVSKISNHFY